MIDMPPGTGDVPLTVFQSIPVDGIVMVTSPQDLVSLIVKKACNMANAMNIPIYGMIENYSYLECPDCGKKISVFGESSIDKVAAESGLKVLGEFPLCRKCRQLLTRADLKRLNTIIFMVQSPKSNDSKSGKTACKAVLF